MTQPDPTAGAYAVYERVRDAVRQIAGTPAAAAAAPVSTASDYWSEELENIDYMIEASPLIVRKLRHHAYHISNVRPYDYRVKHDAKRDNFEARLRALQALDGGARLVPESPALGGFGYEIDGRLFNVDTLKFYEVLVGMERAGVLSSLRGLDRPMVCEIGAGWAGFAYQLRTLIPSSRYVVVDFAELFLFSATYLGTLFPDARMVFCGTAETPSVADAGDADLIFVPHTMAAQVSSLPLDLTVNMVSFQEMTGEQVRAYADMAADAGCPWLYSFNRDRSPFNPQITSVTESIADRYQLTEVAVLPTDYTTVLKKPPKAGKNVERSEFNYRHLAGRLAPSARLRASRSGAAGPGTAPAAESGSPVAGPPVVLGMTLYNKAVHLREALDSVLTQTFGDFRLVLLDDASVDGTEAIAREYAARDPRVSYVRHDTRQAMVATWREVAETAWAACPSARYFAWVSDHDRWHPRWLDRLMGELEDHPGTVLAYPITRRLAQDGTELEKGPRLFDTAGVDGVRERWSRFCREGIGSGDMVYGLMAIDALRQAGIFRPVLRPDRLLIAELSLRGQFRQVPEVLWFRRDSEGASVDRQRHSLFLPGAEPEGFGAPPWWQHARSLWRTYAAGTPSLGLSRTAWMVMLAQYQLTYGWRHFRKTEASHAIGRGIDNVIWVKKISKHYWHHAVYATLVGSRTAWGRARRLGRRGLYEALMLTHRLGLRGGGNAGAR
jgi:glycosyltransferase involved in cell wall biosynthesis